MTEILVILAASSVFFATAVVLWIERKKQIARRSRPLLGVVLPNTEDGKKKK